MLKVYTVETVGRWQWYVFVVLANTDEQAIEMCKDKVPDTYNYAESLEITSCTKPMRGMVGVVYETEFE